MKKILLIVLPLLLIVGCSKPVEESTLINKDGLMYSPNSDKPYTGEVFTNYDTGEKVYQGTYENGLLIDYSYLNEDGSVKEPIEDSTLIKKDGLMYIPDSDKPYTGEVFKNYSTGEKVYQGTYENGLLVQDSYLNKDGSIKEPINYETTLIERYGVFYTKDTNKPYTGEVFSLYDDGKKKEEGTLKDGYMIYHTKWKYEWGKKISKTTYNGYFETRTTIWKYYDNGQKRSEWNYKYRKSDGLHTYWYENGQKKSETTYKEGEQISEKRWKYYDNGQKFSELNFKDDVYDGLHTYWYENGQKMVEITYKDDVYDGLSTSWDENGQKESEGLFENGNGLETYWYEGKQSGKMEWKNNEMWDGKFITRYENEQKKSEGLLENGNGLDTEWYENGQKKIERTYKDGKVISLKYWNQDGSVIE